VIFFEDEPKNIAAAEAKARAFPDGRIVVIDANKPSAESIWRSICSRLLSGKVNPVHSKREIVFFDLDGTMFDVTATISVIDRGTGRIVHRLTQQEFSAKTEQEWFDQIAAADSSVNRSDLALDFGDFKLAERVAQQINFPRHLRRRDSKEIRRQNRLNRTGRATE